MRAMHATLALALAAPALAGGCATDVTGEPAGDPAAVSEDDVFPIRELPELDPVEVPPVEPIPIGTSCGALRAGGRTFQMTVDAPRNASYLLDGHNVLRLVMVDQRELGFDSAIAVDAVIVEGDGQAAVYRYPVEAARAAGLHAPADPQTRRLPLVTRATFCFDYEVEVHKTAETSLRRTWEWGVVKRGAATELTLAPGQVHELRYQVDVGAKRWVDDHFAVRGVIVIRNPSPWGAEITSVHDGMGNLMAIVDCGEGFPRRLVPFGVMTCAYKAALPDATPRRNFVWVSTRGIVGDSFASAAVDFAGAEVTDVDGCVAVDDDRVGRLGAVCADAPRRTFAYVAELGPFACGASEWNNVATVAGDDSGAGGTSGWAVAVTVPCDGGCTLGQGWWKNHPAAAAWALFPEGPIFGSGMSALEILEAAPRGDPWLLLARAWVAADLNRLNGAAFGAAAVPSRAAAEVLAAIAPGPRDPDARQRLLELAAALEEYNEGMAGPGRCSQ